MSTVQAVTARMQQCHMYVYGILSDRYEYRLIDDTIVCSQIAELLHDHVS